MTKDYSPKLQQVWPLSEQIRSFNVEIIAVHGLGANPSTTWCKDGINWLTDERMLPGLIPNVRIWTFNYYSNWLGEAPLQRVEILANQLMEFITIKLKGRNTPVIFVGHSFGGIIVADALTRAADRRWKHILQMTVGSIFLGTPFRGSPSVPFARVVAGAAEVLGFQASRNLLNCLLPGRLDDLEEEFTKISHQLDFQVICFFEQLRQPLHPFKKRWKWLKHAEITIVSEEAAILEGFPSYGLGTLHTKMNCFSDPEDGNFKLVARQVAEMARGPRHFFVPGLENHDFVGRDDILAQINQLIVPKSGISAKVGVWGLGGIGKTQIAIRYAYSIKQSCFRAGISVIWVRAANRARFEDSFTEYATLAKIPKPEPRKDPLQAITDWLSDESNGKWIMILDSADNTDLFGSVSHGELGDANLSRYIPNCAHGSLLITSRVKQICLGLTGTPKSLIHIDMMVTEDCTRMLRQTLTEDLIDNSADRLIECLGNLPIALAQATSFMSTNCMTISSYLELYEESEETRIDLLGGIVPGTRDNESTANAVAATWVISFTQIKCKDPLAADILSFMSFVDRQDIPESMIPRCIATSVKFTKALGTLKSYSMVTPTASSHAFDIHSLVQLSMRNWLQHQQSTQIWLGEVLYQLNTYFPRATSVENWPLCARFVPHILAILSFTASHPSISPTLLIGSSALETDDLAAREHHISLMISVASYLSLQHEHILAETFGSSAYSLALETFGPEHWLTLRAMSNIAITRSDPPFFDLDYGIPLQEKCVELNKIVWGENSWEHLYAVKALGVMYSSAGRLEAARALIARALEGHIALLGENHLWTLCTMVELAALDVILPEKLHREEGAMMLEWVNTNLDADFASGPELWNARHSLAVAYKDMGELGKALRVMKTEVENLETLLEREHTGILQAKLELTRIYEKQENLGAARKVLEDIFTIWGKKLGEEHYLMKAARLIERRLFISLCSLARNLMFYSSQQRCSDADHRSG